MRYSVITEVVDSANESVDLEIQYHDDVLTFTLDGKEVFSADWTCNMQHVFWKLLSQYAELKDDD